MGDAYNEHHCRYRILANSLQKNDSTYQWIERCRCQRLISVQQMWIPEMYMRPNGEVIENPVQRKMKIIKTWFHPDGTLWRITGDKNSQNDAKNQQNVPDHEKP